MAPLRKAVHHINHTVHLSVFSRQQCLLMINLVWIDQLCSYFTSLMTQGRPDCYSFWGQKAKQTRSQVRVVYISSEILFRMITSVWISQLYSDSSYVSFITIPIDFRSKSRWLMLQVRVVYIHSQIRFRMITPV